ncbi:MAG: TIGR00266 family protein [Chromatiales bacterium]|jgi:uncharacterized protein (TIGR00266 family)|nr:TIGR00266 family protein [Chromatiales bacterium]
MRRSHEVEYRIEGQGAQMLIVELDPGESVIAEAGVMNFMEDGIAFDTKLGDGSDPDQGFFGKVFSAGARMVTGESLFMTHFTHEGRGKAEIGFAAPYPGSVVAIDLALIDGEVTCQKDSFLCAALGTKVSVTFSRKLGAGLFGGEGFVLQKLEGDGLCFLHAGGAVVRRQLNNQTLRVDTGCIVGFTSGVDYSVERSGGLKSMLFGGEGIFLATLRGTGTVWLQSLPFSRLADRILAFAPSVGGDEKGED